MIEQNYNLNTIPSASPVPIVHVSQYDKGSRTLKFKLFEGSGEYSMASVNGAKINGKKPDGNAFSYNMTIAGNVVSVDVTEQMTAVAGRVVSEIVLTGANSSVLGTANFIIEVEESPMDEGVISETDLPIFEQLVSDAQTAADTASAAATSVSAILPASSGTPGQVLTKTATGADWATIIMYKTFVSDSITLAQYETGSVAINVSVPGYKPLGVVELLFTNTVVFTASRWSLNSARTTLNIDVVNNWNGSRSSSIAVTVLYVKNA